MDIKYLANETSKPIHNEEEWNEEFQNVLKALNTSIFAEDGTYKTMHLLILSITSGTLKYLQETEQL